MQGGTVLIGLSGLAGAGKDTVRNVLEEWHEFEGIAFADPMREMLQVLLSQLGAGPEWMTDRALKEIAIPGLGLSYRQMAQQLGTEWGRAMDPEIWLKIAGQRVRLRSEQGFSTVISDVRFPNEADWIRAQGGVIWKVLRPGVEGVRAHESEEHADKLPYDYTILNNGTIGDLVPAVRAALQYCFEGAA